MPPGISPFCTEQPMLSDLLKKLNWTFPIRMFLFLFRLGGDGEWNKQASHPDRKPQINPWVLQNLIQQKAPFLSFLPNSWFSLNMAYCSISNVGVITGFKYPAMGTTWFHGGVPRRSWLRSMTTNSLLDAICLKGLGDEKQTSWRLKIASTTT